MCVCVAECREMAEVGEGIWVSVIGTLCVCYVTFGVDGLSEYLRYMTHNRMQKHRRHRSRIRLVYYISYTSSNLVGFVTLLTPQLYRI
jgi:hypothetical protein